MSGDVPGASNEVTPAPSPILSSRRCHWLAATKPIASLTGYPLSPGGIGVSTQGLQGSPIFLAFLPRLPAIHTRRDATPPARLPAKRNAVHSLCAALPTPETEVQHSPRRCAGRSQENGRASGSPPATWKSSPAQKRERPRLKHGADACASKGTGRKWHHEAEDKAPGFNERGGPETLRASRMKDRMGRTSRMGRGGGRASFKD